MSKRPEPKVVTRVVELSETDWEWLCNWLGQLLKTIGVGDMNNDTLRMGAILRQMDKANRKGDIMEDVKE